MEPSAASSVTPATVMAKNPPSGSTYKKPSQANSGAWPSTAASNASEQPNATAAPAAWARPGASRVRVPRSRQPSQRAQDDENRQGGHPRSSLSSSALASASWRVSPDTKTTMISTPATMSRKIPASTMNGNVATRVIAPRKTPFSTR